MSYPVTYYCPHCGAYAELEREGYLADKSVTPYPLVGWTYVEPEEDYEAEGADGVVFTCGADGTLVEGAGGTTVEGASGTTVEGAGGTTVEGASGTTVEGAGGTTVEGADGALDDDGNDASAAGCGERFYLSFVRFENGEEVVPEPESESVELGIGPRRPSGSS